jgi:transcriptional regulator with XRE-family HTH domain
MSMSKIGQQIKTIRTLRGMSQIELGRAVGVSHATISYIESGTMVPNGELVGKIKAALAWPSDVAVDAAFALLAE